MANERLYPITICGEAMSLTLQELRWFLTREAYDMYMKVHSQKGKISFGVGALCSDDFVDAF